MTQLTVKVPAQRPHQPEHQSWCVNHIPGADDGDFGTCMSADVVLPDMVVGVTWQLDEGVRLNVCHGDHIAVVTLDEAERQAHALLAQVAVAREVSR